jgi:AraC-like DNA-binding protein
MPQAASSKVRSASEGQGRQETDAAAGVSPFFSSHPETGRCPLPAGLGTGFRELVDFHSGMRLFAADYTLHKPKTIRYGAQHSFCGLGFYLSGTIRVGASCFPDTFMLGGGQSAVFISPDIEEYTESVYVQRVVRVALALDGDMLQSLALENEGLLSEALSHDPQVRPGYVALAPVSSVMRTTVIQMLACPYHGLARRMFLEAKAMELLSHKLNEMQAAAGRKSSPPALSSRDVDCVRHAATLLAADLEQAPSLGELAQAVGMSRSKLHLCFQQVHGCTPFAYLRDRRLETAANLLAQGDMNVTEVAYAVGYASLSHFTKVFAAHFGVLPRRCLKRPVSRRPG